MNKPLISVILPIYNVERQLERCLDSLLSQTYGNLDIVAVDDGSPDRCGKICDKYAKKDSRVRVIHRENGGVSAARNSGVAAALGEYIAFVDPDDYVERDFIEFLYNLLTQNDADISACGAVEVYFSGKTAPQTQDTALHVMDAHEALERMCYNDGFYVTLWDKLYKRELFSGIYFTEGKLFEDTGTTYKLVDRANRIAVKCEPKYNYVLYDQSITNSRFNEKKLDYVEMADEMADFITEKYPDLRPAAERKRMHACFSTLTQLVNSGVRDRRVEKMLTGRIKELKGGALRDPRTPKRDKLAIMSLGFGFGFFATVWKIYLKLKKG